MLFCRVLLSLIVSGGLAVLSTPVFAQAAGAKGENFLYRVISGDTLGDLAERFTYGWSNWSTLQTLNNVQETTELPIGLLLKIPFSLIPELPAVAVVSHLVGHADANGQTLQVKSQLAEGQTVRTGKNGFVTLQLDDGSLLSVLASSSLSIKRLRVFKGTGLTDSIIEVKSGSLESEVAPQKTGVGRFEVRTPVSVTGVRGTRLRVHMSTQGARSEVVQGQAGVEAKQASEVVLREKRGVAVSTSGESTGARDLLSAPDLPVPVRAAAGWTMSFPPVSGASAYLVRVASDPNGSDLVSSQQFQAAQVQFSAPSAGTYYVFVRALDNVGLGGLDARQSFEGKNVLRAFGGINVLSGSGQPVAVANY
ncbi:MAG TPA: FecR domain-containing protein [Eoetvoesiella sp.]